MDHPLVNLRAITITPGSKEQVGVVKKIIALFNKDITIGAGNINHPKNCVSTFHYKWLGNIDPQTANSAASVIFDTIRSHPNLIILTGGPLKNIKAAILKYSINLNQIVCQGGFAGDNIVNKEDVLEKFKGRITCPTFNLNGDVIAANLVLSYQNIKERYFVSKNVCHSILYDKNFHTKLSQHKNKKLSNTIIYNAMEKYLSHKPSGKLFHDPFAAACAIDKTIANFKEVEMYRTKGEYGCNLKPGTNTYITTKGYMDKFFDTMFVIQ